MPRSSPRIRAALTSRLLDAAGRAESAGPTRDPKPRHAIRIGPNVRKRDTRPGSGGVPSSNSRSSPSSSWSPLCTSSSRWGRSRAAPSPLSVPPTRPPRSTLPSRTRKAAGRQPSRQSCWPWRTTGIRRTTRGWTRAASPGGLPGPRLGRHHHRPPHVPLPFVPVQRCVPSQRQPAGRLGHPDRGAIPMSRLNSPTHLRPAAARTGR